MIKVPHPARPMPNYQAHGTGLSTHGQGLKFHGQGLKSHGTTG